MDIITLQKMIFIYKAIKNGWTVKNIGNNKFEFIKDKSKIKKEINLEEFIKNNLNIDNIYL
tara:strand:+ start:38 stop:220 length:183 start_codon:yes stop_codon:yes gene_type:complete